MGHKSEHFTVQRKTPPKATSSPNITAEESWVVRLWEHFRGQDWRSFALAQFVKRPSWGQCQVHRWPIEEASSFQLGLHILFSQRKKNWSLKICLLNQEVDNANCDITICRVGRLWHKLEMGSTRSGWRVVGSQSGGNNEHVTGTRCDRSKMWQEEDDESYLTCPEDRRCFWQQQLPCFSQKSAFSSV